MYILSGENFRVLSKNNDMWILKQVLSPKRANNQHIVGKLEPFPIGILELKNTIEFQRGHIKIPRAKI